MIRFKKYKKINYILMFLSMSIFITACGGVEKDKDFTTLVGNANPSFEEKQSANIPKDIDSLADQYRMDQAIIQNRIDNPQYNASFENNEIQVTKNNNINNVSNVVVVQDDKSLEQYNLNLRNSVINENK